MEWGLPASKARRSGLPGPSRWVCPTSSSIVPGRSRSASGAWGSLLLKRSFTDHVRAFGRREAKCLRRQFDVALDSRELDHGDLAELVAQFHRLQSALSEAQPDLLERGVFRLRHGLEPVEPFLVADSGKAVVLLDLVASCKERRRARAERPVEAAHRDLVEILVVEPDLLAIADDHLLLGFVVLPAEFAGPRELHGAGRLLKLLQVLVEHHLREAGARGRCLLQRRLQGFDARAE